MGDTGSLAIGGLLGTVAILGKFEILLILIAGVFVMETLSVIIQVASFKSTGKEFSKWLRSITILSYVTGVKEGSNCICNSICNPFSFGRCNLYFD